jgi:hypothetical protein
MNVMLDKRNLGEKNRESGKERMDCVASRLKLYDIVCFESSPHGFSIEFTPKKSHTI